jgi:hypothetical protein
MQSVVNSLNEEDVVVDIRLIAQSEEEADLLHEFHRLFSTLDENKTLLVNVCDGVVSFVDYADVEFDNGGDDAST